MFIDHSVSFFNDPSRGSSTNGNASTQGRNDPRVLTVSELTRKVRSLLEFQIGDIWVEGEISNFRRQQSGHCYFALKDRTSQISCVLFRSDAEQLKVELADGMQVQIYGRLSVYEARGQYQLIAKTVQQKGLGILQAKFEALKRKLEAEGLFDPEKKKPIPKFPKTIALITSPTGAALRDMLNILSRRAPWVRLIIVPVLVQGNEAAYEIVDAFEMLSEAEDFPEIDTVVLTRGGGSIEDLWSFNEERVARAIHRCALPVVSAVGHEIDFTIADFVADKRAPTPSAAAELIVPDREELVSKVETLQRTMTATLERQMDHAKKIVELTAGHAMFGEPKRVLREHQQSVDYLSESLQSSATETIVRLQRELANAQRVLEAQKPEYVIEDRREKIASIKERLDNIVKYRVAMLRKNVQPIRDVLKTLGPQATLSRGYSMTMDAEGNILTKAEDIKSGDTLRTVLADGEVESEVK